MTISFDYEKRKFNRLKFQWRKQYFAWLPYSTVNPHEILIVEILEVLISTYWC